MLDFFSDDVRRNPYPIYEQMRSTLPVFKDTRSGFWMIFDYANVRRALNDTAVFSSRAAPPGGKPLDWLIFSDPPRHTRLRALVSQAFTARAVAALELQILNLSRELLDRMCEKSRADLCAEYSVPLPLKVISFMIGVPPADWQRFRNWSDGILRLSDTVFGGDAAAKAVADFRESTADMRAYLQEAIAERRSCSKDDLLSRLVEAEVDGARLTEEEILGFFQLLLLAGHETTTNLINNAFLCLAENPGDVLRLRQLPHRLPPAIEEVLRYRSPVQAVFRATTKDVEMGGQSIPAGNLVLVMVGAANRDPEQFANAERFDIDREQNPHLAFGLGSHFCLGAPLARLEARIALTHLMERLETFELADSEPWPPRLAFHVHGPSKLVIRTRSAGKESAEEVRAGFVGLEGKQINAGGSEREL